MIIGKLPSDKPYRVSSNAVWPLRRADGRTWAEHKKEQDKQHADR